MDAMYNFTIPMDDFKDLLEDIENFHRNQEKKKIEKLMFECIQTKITLDTDDLRVIQDCTEAKMQIGFFWDNLSLNQVRGGDILPQIVNQAEDP